MRALHIVAVTGRYRNTRVWHPQKTVNSLIADAKKRCVQTVKKSGWPLKGERVIEK